MSYKIITGPESIQGSQEWLEFRRSKIGASMAAAILGIDPWTSPLQLWEQIVLQKEKKSTYAMQRGKNLEQKARDWLSNMMNTAYRPEVIQSLEYPDLIASLDAFCELPDGNVAIAEIKAPNQKTHQEAIDGKIPQHYVAQMQHQMMVAGVKSMLYCSFDGTDGVILPCIRDEKFCQKLVAKEMAFLASLINFDPPEPCDMDWDEIVDPEKVEKVCEYTELSKQKQALEEHLNEMKRELISDAPSNRMRLGDFRMTKIPGRTTIDYKLLLKDLEIVPGDEYRKKGKDYWTISC